MKIVPFLSASTVRETTTASLSTRVCMHILRKARTDVRAMRAATALVEAGYSVSIVDIEGGNECTQSTENINGVRVKHVSVPNSYITSRLEKWVLIRAAHMFIRSTLQLIQTPADIYHALDLPALPACYIAAILRRKPVIFESYELPFKTSPVSEKSMSRRWLDALLAPFFRIIIPRCAAVITVSPPIVDEFRQRYHCQNVSLIRSVPKYRDVSKSDRLRRYLSLKPEVRIALYQGYLQPNRGLDRLVRAASFLEQDIVIVMMGGNIGKTQAELEALIASEGVADCVKILPPVPYAELLDWTASADIGLNVASPDYSLNVRYSLPNKLFEYLMAGLPVLSSPIEAIVDVIKTYDAGQVMPSLAPADIGEAINRMLADLVGLARKRSNALEAARNDLNWERESLQLMHFYQGILQDGVRKISSNKHPTYSN